MADENKQSGQQKMQAVVRFYSPSIMRLIILVAAIAAVAYLIVKNIDTSVNIIKVVLGFSAVVFIHECGHFIVAKLANIKVEAFAIFIPPVLCGIKRTEKGFRIRILPKFFPKKNDPEGDGLLSFTIGKKAKPGETEYQIGLIPLAGYVKMLGQEDTGADKASEDPRSFSNKSIPARMAVIAAGVIFNVIAAVGILMLVYTVGMNRTPAVVGDVVANSPAERAGLKPNDEILEIAGRSYNIDFGNIVIAAALSDKGEQVEMKVQREDGSIKNFAFAAEQLPNRQIRTFGILSPQTLTIAKLPKKYAKLLLEKTQLEAGDKIKSVNGKDVSENWQINKIIENIFEPFVTIAVERTDKDKKTEIIETKIPLALNTANRAAQTESKLGSVYSLVPRLKIADVTSKSDSNQPYLQSGDVILAVGEIENPTYEELNQTSQEYKDKQLPIKVLRKNENKIPQTLTVNVVPKYSVKTKRVMLGIGICFNLNEAAVAKIIDVNGISEPAIPSGAIITAVGKTKVKNFFDIAKEIKKNAGKNIEIYYSGENKKGKTILSFTDAENFGFVQPVMAEYIPFASLERLYKAENPAEAFKMARKKSVWFVVQTYATLKGLFTKNVSTKAMSGPVGIATVMYAAVQHSFLSFLYLLAFISANLAVVNFLPIPVVDGGVFVMLIIEKIKGSPVSIKVQEVVTYAGLIFLGAVFIYFTYNDIMRIILG